MSPQDGVASLAIPTFNTVASVIAKAVSVITVVRVVASVLEAVTLPLGWYVRKRR